MEGDEKWAFFDLDQTIVPWDTQLLFCNWVLKREPWRRLLMVIFLAFLPLAKVLGDGGLKRVFLVYLWGMDRRRLLALAEEFGEWVVKEQCYERVLAEVKQCRAEGRVLVLSSASPEIYVQAIGRQLGFDYAFGTRFEFGERVVKWAPDFVTDNNKGAEKVRRFEEEGLFPKGTSKLIKAAGYSDSRADVPMLELCEQVTLVNPKGSFAMDGEKQGWRIWRPERPSRGSAGFAWGCVRQMLGLFW